MIKTALIFAAGRGERLKPITDTCTKAMCTLHGIPLIEHHIIRLAKAGFERVVINHAYLGYQIRQHLRNGARWHIDIQYSAEPPGALETGGGLLNALPLLGKEPFMTLNADIVTDYDPSMTQQPLLTQSLAHIVLVPKPHYLPHADFGLSPSHYVTNSNRVYTFPGIAYYRPEAFVDQQLGRYSIVPLLRQWVDEQRVSGEIYLGQWQDIGSPDRLRDVNNRSD